MYFKLPLLIALLSSVISRADVTYVATSYFIIPGSQEEKDWKKCAEISPSYMAELMSFRRLARDLHNLLFAPEFPGRSAEISRMRAELKVHSDRLLLLAKPEWNTENRRWHLMWTIPGTDFFEARPPDLGWTKFPPMKKGDFVGFSTGEIKLLGERRPDLRQRLWVELDKGWFRDVEVMLSKESTFLEFCQIVRSIEIDLSIRYESEHWKGMELDKKYKLIFRENL